MGRGERGLGTSLTSRGQGFGGKSLLFQLCSLIITCDGWRPETSETGTQKSARYLGAR